MAYGLEKIGFKEDDRILIYGIGNVGRQDDGLGIRLIEMLEAAGLSESFTLEANYQLNIEDALLMSDFDVVLFADASREADGGEPFSVRPVKAETGFTFTTHAMSVARVLGLCEKLYGRNPRTFLMALPGYEWEISQVLSALAERNLGIAFKLLVAEAQCTKCL